MAEILKGTLVAAAMNELLSERVKDLKQQDVSPCLAIVRIGDSPDDLAYESSAVKRCEKAGVIAKVMALPQQTEEQVLVELIERVNSEKSIHGCLLLRPLPKHFDDERIRNTLCTAKDVDGITDASLAGIFAGAGKGFAPCTAAACIEILDYFGVDVQGKNAVVIGRSLVVGRPLAMMLIKKNATVTICHTATQNTAEICRNADIIFAAAGRAGMVSAEYLREGQTVIDVGINLDENGNLCGDVAWDDASEIVKAITPVPGGVGTVTTSVLVKHVVDAAERSIN